MPKARSKWTKEAIVDRLRSLHRAGRPLSYTALAKSQQALVSAAAYHFGSFRKAVEKAGIDYATITRRPRWTKPLVIQLIKQARRRDEDLHWSAVVARRDELGRAAFAALQKRLFGSWERALLGAGLDVDDVSRYRRWTRDAVAFELRDRHSSGDALNSGAVQKQEPGLHAAAVRHFGSYDAALRRAGVDPARVRERRRWTRADALRQLAALARRRKSKLTDAAVRKSAPALYGALIRMFKSVPKALAARGK